MVISISQQAMLVLLCFISGMATGVLFDLYRLFRGIQEPNRLITLIQDILFWIFTSLLVFIFLSINDYAYIGLYSYLCMALGLVFYFLFLSKFNIAVFYCIINISGIFLRTLKNILCFPFGIIIEYLRNLKEIKKKP
ncbi:MAG: spore cortex biosynthesis protein YabQ [Solirubrobacterales bacterium]